MIRVRGRNKSFARATDLVCSASVIGEGRCECWQTLKAPRLKQLCVNPSRRSWWKGERAKGLGLLGAAEPHI